MVFSIAIHTTLFVRVLAAEFTEGLTSICRRRGLKSRPTLAIFILILLSFAGATICWASYVAFCTIPIRAALVKNVGMELSERLALANAATEMASVALAIFSLFVVS